MLNLQHVIFRSLIYIGILSPFVFIACFVIICISQYLKHKSEKNQEVSNLEKKYKKQNKSKYATLTDITSESSTESLWIKVERPNHQSIRTNKTHSEMNRPVKDSVKESFINVPGKRYFEYSDPTLLFTEVGKCENPSESETYVELLHSQNDSNNLEEELISPKLHKSVRTIQSRCRDELQNAVVSDNSKRKQCKCNSDLKKSHNMQSNTTKQDHSIDNSNFVDVSLNINPAEEVHKNNDHRIKVHDRECGRSQAKKISDNNKKFERNNIILDHQFQQYGFESDQEYIVKPINKSSLLKTYEKCPTCTVLKEKKFVPVMQETEYFPNGKHNPQENNNHHKDFRVPVFQNSNIPIAKRVLEEDQFYDLRQKFYSAENTFQNALKPTKYELNFNTWNNKNKELYQTQEKLHLLEVQRNFEEENIKDSEIQHTAQVKNVTEETGNENQTENVSSTCDSTGKEELVCQFWKSLKTETVGQKRNKAIQTGISHVGSKNANETNAHLKQKPQEGKQNTKAMKTALNNTQNQIIQASLSEKLLIPKESSQIEIVEHDPKVQSISLQVPDDMRNIENKMYRNCQHFLSSADYSEENNKFDTTTTKPMTLYSRPRMMQQTEFQQPCHRPFQLDSTQLTEDTNFHHCNNCYFRPNFVMEHENVYNRYNSDHDLQNINNYVCNPIMSMNHGENKQYMNWYDTRQIKKNYSEKENVASNNPCINFDQHDKYKYRTPTVEKIIYYKNGHMQQQLRNRQLLNHEPSNKMSVKTHQCIPNSSLIDNFYNQAIFWNNENAISQENKFYDRNIEKQCEDNLMQHSACNSRNSRSKTQDVTQTDVKAVQTSEEDTALISSNNGEECNKQISKERVKESNSKTEIDRKQVLEKNNAEQNHTKENVVRQIRRMYPHIDQKIHETNKNVIIQVKSFLQKKGKWQSENN